MCTNFLISPSDNSHIVGRSMENGIPMNSQVVVRGVGQKITSPSSVLNERDPDGLSWTTTYGYVGLNALGFNWVTDGMNTQGLSIAMQTLPEAQYQTVTDTSKALACQWVCDWVLGTCATVQEVINNLPNVEIWGFSEGTETYTTAHFSIFDKSGNGLVVELLNGQQVTYQNTVGVCTNGPTFDWHLTNIGNYTGLTPTDAAPIMINGQTFSQPGHGSGLMSIPGDSTPPSRFIRIAYLKQFADKPATAVDGVNLAFHLLNTVDIPQGISQSGGILNTQDYTQYVSVRDMTNLLYYIRISSNMTPMMIDLQTINFSAATLGITSLPPTALAPAVNITANISTE